MENRIGMVWRGMMFLALFVTAAPTFHEARAQGWFGGGGKAAGGEAKQAETDLRNATSAYGSADYSKVIALTSEILKKNPRHAGAYSLRGKAYKDMGDVAKALADVNKAIELDATLGEAYFVRGQVNEINGEMAKAGQDYVKACKNGYKTACAR
ncbi:MAG: tetratricopeptide repeat protein [Nitrospinae bacterium]|nr:tetratricopeptide repeat protein [Nitrospinota bacterium]